MQNETLARRYSQALYDLCKKDDSCHAQLKELKLVLDLYEGHKDLRLSIESPTVAAAVKKNILRDLLTSKVKDRTLNFLYLLIDKGRVSLFTTVAALFEKQLKDDSGVVEARVEVAEPLDEQLNALISTRLLQITGKRVEMEVIVRPELIAGAVITIGDRLYDGSVKYHLEEIRERLGKG